MSWSRDVIAKRHNCKPVIIWKEDGSCRQSCISIGEASRITGISKAAVRRALNDGHKTFGGWFVDEGERNLPAEAPKRAVRLTSAESEELYQLLKKELVWVALHRPYEKDYCWPLYDEVVKAGKLKVHDSHEEYEYWRDWKEKNRDDLYEDRYSTSSEDEE